MVKFHPPRERWLKKTVTEITDDKQVPEKNYNCFGSTYGKFTVTKKTHSHDVNEGHSCIAG